MRVAPNKSTLRTAPKRGGAVVKITTKKTEKVRNPARAGTITVFGIGEVFRTIDPRFVAKSFGAFSKV